MTLKSLTARFCPVLLLLAACAGDPDAAKRAALEKGNSYLAADQFNEAIIEFRRAVQIDANFGEARKQLSTAYLRSGDNLNALRESVRAADLLPSDDEVQVRAGNLLLAAGQFEDARTRADGVLARNPSHASALVVRGNALANLKDLDGALIELEEAAASAPSDGLILSNIGAVQMARGDQAKAEEAFRRATELSPNSVLAHVAYANYLMLSRHVDRAEEELKKALAAAPSDVTANRALAVLYLTTRRPAAAEPYVKKVSEVSNDPKARFALARFYVATQRQDDAMRELQTLAAQKATQTEATLQIAALQYGAGQKAEGRRLLAQVLASSPTDAHAIVLDAEFLLREQKFSDAITAGSNAVARDPSLTGAYYIVGLAQEGMRDLEAAKKSYNEVLRLAPSSTRAQLALSRLHLLTGDTPLAQQFATRAATTTRSPEARQALIRAMLANGDFGTVEAQLKALKADYPESAIPYSLEGALRMSQKNLPAANRAFARAVELDPRSVDAVSGTAQVLLASGRGNDARQFVTQLVTSNPEQPDMLVVAARTHATLRDFATSEALLRKALAFDPSRTETYTMLARLLVLQGKLDQALAEYRIAIQKRPTAIVNHIMSATLLQVQNRRADAKQGYRNALAISPTAAVAANNLAWMMVEDGEDLDAALQLAQTAKAQLPESPDTADTLGWIYFKKGLHAQAVVQLREAVEKRPLDAGFNYRLGLAYVGAGEFKLARQSLETALRLDPKAREATEARAALMRLTSLGS